MEVGSLSVVFGGESILVTILIILLFFFGLYQIVVAIWELRQGNDRSVFIRHAMIGVILLVVASFLPVLLLGLGSLSAVTHFQSNASFSSGSTVPVP